MQGQLRPPCPSLLRFSRLRLLLLSILPAFLVPTAHGQSFSRKAFTPTVIRHDRTLPVLLEATVTGNPTRVVLEIDGEERPMRDDGMEGDALSGDGIYSILIPASDVTARLAPEDVFRPHLGFAALFNGETRVARVNLFAELWTEDIGLVPVTGLADDAQMSPHIVNFVGDLPPQNVDVRPWAQKFYDHFPDDFDFLNFIYVPGYFGNRFHRAIQNSIEGIGITIFDNSMQYGGRRLQGINVFPITSFFDGANRGYQHELGHQWVNFLDGTPLGAGVPHWPLSDLASGIMGWSRPGGQGLQFPFDLVPEGDDFRLVLSDSIPAFSDLSLYLMGLIPPSEVGTHFVFDDQNQTPRLGEVLRGPVTEVQVDDIIAIQGPRSPSHAESQKVFRIGTIIISPDLLSAEAMAFFDFFSRRAMLEEPVQVTEGFVRTTMQPFFLSTGGRARLDTRLVIAPATPFARGDCNSDGAIDVSDPIFLLNGLFGSGPRSSCTEATDIDDDGGVDIADPVYLLNRLFGGGPAVPPPNPTCGLDPEPPGLGCTSFPPCE